MESLNHGSQAWSSVKSPLIHTDEFSSTEWTSKITFFFFLVRKIGHELTSVANLPLFCMWDAATVWLDERSVGLHLGSQT